MDRVRPPGTGVDDARDGRVPAGEAHAGRMTFARSTDPDEAQELVADVYLRNRVAVSSGTGFDMALAATHVGDLTVGRLTYATSIRLTTEPAHNFHINIPTAGFARSRSGSADPAVTSPGSAAVFAPGREAEIIWSAGCTQLCLMAPRSLLDAELSELLGRSIHTPLEFDFRMDLATPAGRSWLGVLRVVAREFDDGPGLAAHPTAGRHLKRLLVDGLLLGHRHNYSEALDTGTAAPRGAIAKAVDLLEDRPDEAWSSSVLAREVHLSVRSLQEGFKRHVGTPPMAYLRRVRLHRVRDDLESAVPGSTTVESIAARWGIVHMGRFAAAYRTTFGEPPSATLRRGKTIGGRRSAG